jgi:MFS family permease
MTLAEISRTMTAVQVPVYLRELGANIGQIGLFFTISLIFPLLLRIFGGWLSDTIGRLRALFLGSAAGAITYAVYAFAPSWQAALPGPAFLACATALIYPSYKAYIADLTNDSNRGRFFGITDGVIRFAWVIGPPVGGLIGQALGYRTMFLASFGSYTVAALLFLSLTRKTSKPAAASMLSWPSLKSSFLEMGALILAGGLVTWILIVDGVRDIAFKLSFDLMPVYLSDIAGISKTDIGILDGLFGLAIVLSTFPAGVLVDKVSERLGIVLGLLLMILSRLVFAFANGFCGFALSWILLGMGGGLLDPAGSSLIARGVPSRLRGIAYGLVATSLGIFSLPAPWIGSQIWQSVNPRAPFLITVIIGLLTIFPAWKKLVVLPQAEKAE